MSSTRAQRRGWALVAVLVVLGVIVALGGTLMSGMVRQRREMRRAIEEQQARWLTMSVARMSPDEAGDAWKPSLAANAPVTKLRARIEQDGQDGHSDGRRIVVESSENEKWRIVYSEILVTPSSK